MTLEGARDEYDRKAHDIICILRYGNVGGGVHTDQMYKVSDILRGHPYQPKLPPPPIVLLPPPPPIIVLK